MTKKMKNHTSRQSPDSRPERPTRALAHKGGGRPPRRPEQGQGGRRLGVERRREPSGQPHDEQGDYGAAGGEPFDAERGRDSQNLLPGVKPVLEMLEAAPERVDAVFLRKGRHGKEMDRIADLCRENGIRFSLLQPESFARIYSGSSQGVVARIFEAGFTDWEDLAAQVMDAPLPLILALDQVQDPGNAGTLARTLYALGGAGMVVPRHNGVFLGAAASRASAGALTKLPVAKVGNLGQALDQARDEGFTVYGAAAEAGAGSEGRQSENVFTLTPRLPAILVLGSEEAGLRQMIEKRCDVLVHIPMLRDFDSMNVAQAGAIILGVFSGFAKK